MLRLSTACARLGCGEVCGTRARKCALVEAELSNFCGAESARHNMRRVKRGLHEIWTTKLSRTPGNIFQAHADARAEDGTAFRFWSDVEDDAEEGFKNAQRFDGSRRKLSETNTRHLLRTNGE